MVFMVFVGTDCFTSFIDETTCRQSVVGVTVSQQRRQSDADADVDVAAAARCDMADVSLYG